MATIWNGLCICVWMLGTNFTNAVLSSHFKGAAVSWRPGLQYDADKTEILIDFRIAWRRSTEADSLTTFCDREDVLNGKLLSHGYGEDYQWQCVSGCSGPVATAEVRCTQFDVEDDWSVGFRSVSFNITGIQPFEIKFSGCCWISALVYSTNSHSPSEWDLTIRGNLGIRSDTALPNRSPISAATPIIRFQAGCPNFVDLVMYDADQDTVTCRFAECNNPSCTLYPYLKLTQQGDKCRLSYNAGGPGNTNVAISIVLEDFPKSKSLIINGVLQNTTTVLSSVSLQFIVKLYSDIHACSLRPTWIANTFPNGFVRTGVVGQELTTELYVRSDIDISAVNVIGPPGLQKGPVEIHKANEFRTTLSFTPSSGQAGYHMVCITAKDINGKMSEQRCMVLNIGVGSPCDVNNGGCDDECIPTGDSYVCECRKSCWRIAEDRRTCIPNITVTCQPDHFSVKLPTCAVGGSTVAIGYHQQLNLGLPDSTSCQANVEGNNYVRDVTYHECSTQQETDFSEIHYHNQLRMWVDDRTTLPGSGDNRIPITRGFYYNMQVVCSFNKYANVNATFRPQDQEEGLVRVPGLGSFQFFFDFFVGEDFNAAYSPYEYPITVTVNSDIYFGIRTVGGTGLQVFTEKCVAMTTPTPTENTVHYTMIEDGCLSDGTLQKHPAPSAMEDRYSIKAFRFQDNLNTDNSVNIYIKCSAVLCVVGDPNTRCQKGCIRTRKRRSGDDEIYIDTRQKRAADDAGEQPTFTPNVSESNLLEITVSGPFRIEVEQTEGTPLVTVVTPTNVIPTTKKPPAQEVTRKPVPPSKEPDSITIVIIASAVGGTLFLLLLILLVGLIMYYHIALKPRHKVIPNKEDPPSRSISAWTLERQEIFNGRTYEDDMSKTPPPPFWDVQPLT